jgi:hypothetical protein
MRRKNHRAQIVKVGDRRMSVKRLMLDPGSEVTVLQQPLFGESMMIGPLSVLCGIDCLGELTQSKLSSLGFSINDSAFTLLVLDFPYGYGFSILERLRSSRVQSIVMTWNLCRE